MWINYDTSFFSKGNFKNSILYNNAKLKRGERRKEGKVTSIQNKTFFETSLTALLPFYQERTMTNVNVTFEPRFRGHFGNCAYHEH